jgi:hypothetical protein
VSPASEREKMPQCAACKSADCGEAYRVVACCFILLARNKRGLVVRAVYYATSFESQWRATALWVADDSLSTKTEAQK